MRPLSSDAAECAEFDDGLRADRPLCDGEHIGKEQRLHRIPLVDERQWLGGYPVNDSPEANVTTLALLNLIRLLAAELVAGAHRYDVEKVVAAIDLKLDTTPLPRGIDVNDARAGIKRARDLLRPYVAQLRKQARSARAVDSLKASSGKPPRLLQ